MRDYRDLKIFIINNYKVLSEWSKAITVSTKKIKAKDGLFITINQINNASTKKNLKIPK